MMSLSILDWVIVLIVLLSVLQAIANGFLREFFEFVGVVAAYLIAAWEYRVVARWFSRFMAARPGPRTLSDSWWFFS